jgi:hypothetical protein
MEPKRSLQFAAGQRFRAEFREQAKFDGREQNLGWPESHANFHDSSRR